MEGGCWVLEGRANQKKTLVRDSALENGILKIFARFRSSLLGVGAAKLPDAWQQLLWGSKWPCSIPFSAALGT